MTLPRSPGALAVAFVAFASALAAQAEPRAVVPAQPAVTQDKTPQKELIRLRDEKLALPVFQKAPWTFDYDAARARARKEGKPIFVYFSRSYAH